MDLLTESELIEDLCLQLAPKSQSPPPFSQTAENELAIKEPDLLLSPASSNASSVKRKIQDTNPNNGVSPKRTKASYQTTDLPSKKHPKHSKPKLTVPYSPILRTSSRLRNKTVEVGGNNKTEGKSKIKIPSGKSFEIQITNRTKTGFNSGVQEVPKSKTTRAVSPKLSTKARANARQAKQDYKGK